VTVRLERWPSAGCLRRRWRPTGASADPLRQLDDNHVVTYEPSFVRGADSLSLASAINHPGGTADLTCTEDEADIDVQTATLTAIKVDSLG